jgi:hypothetical protein
MQTFAVRSSSARQQEKILALPWFLVEIAEWFGMTIIGEESSKYAKGI